MNGVLAFIKKKKIELIKWIASMMFIWFLEIAVIHFIYALISPDDKLLQTIKIWVGVAGSILIVFLLLFYVIDVENKFLLKVRNAIEKTIPTLLFIGIQIFTILLSYSNKLQLTKQEARDQLTIFWTIYAILFAFILMVMPIAYSKLFDSKTNKQDNDMCSLYCNHLKRNTFNIIIASTTPTFISVIITGFCLFASTMFLYPSLEKTYGLYDQWLVYSTNNLIATSFLMVIYCAIRHVLEIKNLKKELDAMDIVTEQMLIEQAIEENPKLYSAYFKEISLDASQNKNKIKNKNKKHK